MENNYIRKIHDNLKKYNDNICCNISKKQLYLSDLARYIKNEIVKETNNEDVVYSICQNDVANKVFDNIISSDVFSDSCNKCLSQEDKIFICNEIIEDYRDIYSTNKVYSLFCEDYEKCIMDSYKTISYVRSLMSNKASEIFAKILGKITMVPKDNYSTLFEDIKMNVVDYVVIPVENSNDGRLSSFRNLIDMAGLYTIVSCNITNDKYEKTQFDLVSSKFKIFDSYSHPMIRFRITFDNMGQILSLLNFVESCSASIYRLYALSSNDMGRDNAFDIICDIKDADLPLLACLLKLFYPQYIFSGIYEMKEDLYDNIRD